MAPTPPKEWFFVFCLENSFIFSYFSENSSFCFANNWWINNDCYWTEHKWCSKRQITCTQRNERKAIHTVATWQEIHPIFMTFSNLFLSNQLINNKLLFRIMNESQRKRIFVHELICSYYHCFIWFYCFFRLRVCLDGPKFGSFIYL